MTEPGDSQEEIVARLLRLAGPRPDAPLEAKARVKAIVHAQWRERVKARRRRSLIWLSGSLAAAAVVVLAVGLEIRRGGPAPPAAGEPAGTLILSVGAVRGPGGEILQRGDDVPPGSILETGEDDRAALRLSGQAIVRMDRGTRIKLSADPALELERGTIYVDSDEATKEPGGLAIKTGIGIVRDVGTRFEVRVRDGELRVRVRQGAVSVDHEGRSREILSGTQLSVDEAGGARTETVPPYGPEWSWILDVAPEFELEGRTLGEFLKWVSSETGLRVKLTGESEERKTMGIILHGSVAGLRPDQAPAAVLPTCGLGYSVVGDTLIISSH